MTALTSRSLAKWRAKNNRYTVSIKAVARDTRNPIRASAWQRLWGAK